MRKKELQKIRTKPTTDLEQEVSKLRIEARKTKADIFAGKETNLRKSGAIRKDIAQILTILKEKEIGEKQRPELVSGSKKDSEMNSE